MEPLQELPLDQWSLLKEKLKISWPLNMDVYYALDTIIKHPRLRDIFNFKVYCPYGDMSDGFVATSVMGKHKRKEIIIFSFHEDTSKLEGVLASTKIIDWSPKLPIAMASHWIILLMEKLNSQIKFDVFQICKLEMLYLDKSFKPYLDVRCPPNTYLTAVKPEDIKQVDDVWSFQDPTSRFYLSTSTLASNGFSHGLYSYDNKLLAWIFLNESNYLRHLYCEPIHRGKGYGQLLMKIAVNECLEQGTDVYLYVIPENQNMKELAIKLGFQVINERAWIYVGNEMKENHQDETTVRELKSKFKL